MTGFDRLERSLIAAAREPTSAVQEAGRLVWSWFADLSNARQYGMNGPQPIGYGEIETYARLMHLPLEPRHVGLLRRMDNAWMASAYQRIAKHKPGEDGKTLPPASTHPISAELFDAVM